MNGTNLVHHSICVLGELARRDGVPVKDRSLPRSLGDLRRIQPGILVRIEEVHVGVLRLACDKDLQECRLCPPIDIGRRATTTGVDVGPVVPLQDRGGSKEENGESSDGGD